MTRITLLLVLSWETVTEQERERESGQRFLPLMPGCSVVLDSDYLEGYQHHKTDQQLFEQQLEPECMNIAAKTWEVEGMDRITTTLARRP